MNSWLRSGIAVASGASLRWTRPLACWTLAGLIAACASRGLELPYCDSAATAFEVAPPSCQGLPEVQDHARQLFGLIVADVGALLIRVGFDSQSKVGSVCADRPSVGGTWRARAMVAEQVEAIRALPPGPACLAGHRLDFNEYGAERGEIDQLIGGCAGQAQSQRDAAATFPNQARSAAAVSRRTYLSCVESHQQRRGELWFFIRGEEAPLVFTKTSASSSRRAAINECSGYPSPSGRSIFDSRQGVARDGGALLECMRSLGWEYRY